MNYTEPIKKTYQICEKHRIRMRAIPVYCDDEMCNNIIEYHYVCKRCEKEQKIAYGKELKNNKKEIEIIIEELKNKYDYSEKDYNITFYNKQSEITITFEMFVLGQKEIVNHLKNNFIKQQHELHRTNKKNIKKILSVTKTN